MAKTAVRERAVSATASGLIPIPNMKGKPVVGNLLDIDAAHPIRDIMAHAKRLGPIFQLDMLGKTFTIVSSQAIADELFDEKRFDKSVRGALQRIRTDAGGGDGLFTAYTSEPNWHKAHNILLPNFSDRAMASYHPSMLDIAVQMMLKWERAHPAEDIDVTRDMTALTLDTIGLCGFSYRFNSFYRDDNHPFVDAMVKSLEGAMTLRGIPFEDVGGVKMRALKKNAHYMETVADQIVAERKAEFAANPDREKKDLLDYMLVGIDKKTGEGLDDVNIRRQMSTFLIAGHETTSGLLSFCVHYLIKNPEVARRATEEADRVFGTDLSVLPTVKQVNHLTYIQQVLKETLRLWPTAPGFALYPIKDEVLAGKYALPAKSHTLVLLPALHRDPSIWGDRPDEFDPEHFSAEAEAARPASAYKPFGNGQRACIGQQFAMQEATLVIGMLLQRFTLIDHKNYQLEIRESLTIKPEGLTIHVRPRVHSNGRAAASNGIAASNGASNGHATSGAAVAVVEPPVAEKPRHGTPLLVLYGSNLGSSEETARHIAENGTAQGYDVRFGTLDDYVGRLPKTGAVAIVTASYNGAPPDNAAAFYAWLSEGLAPDALAGVRYTVFGAGNKNWASTYQSVPRTIDAKLAEFGAQRIYVRGEGDARDDLDAHFQAWKKHLWQTAAIALGVEYGEDDHVVERPMYEVEFVSGPQPNPLAAAHGATGMRVLANRELQAGGERSTRHIEVALPEGVTYRSGDHLGVLPSNGAGLVERVLQRFGLDATTYVRLHTTGAGRIASLPLQATLSVRRLLMHYVELQGIATRKQIVTLSEYARCPNTKPALLALAAQDSDAYRDEIRSKRTSVLDLLERYPACELPLPVYLEMLPLMTPRYYSISSSPLETPDRLSVTVGVVREPAYSGHGTYEGIASTHLARRDAGTRLFAFVKDSKSSGFSLPEDTTTPIIMIGPGTGLAPFRGFLAERATLKARGRTLGPAMLFFGCRHPERDFIYRDELQAWEQAGLVDLNVAFSRLGETRTYVQNLIARKSDEVWNLMERGAIVYVCGDGSRMEPQVREQFLSMYRARTGASEEAAHAWLGDLTEQRRYVLDVWASD